MLLITISLRAFGSLALLVAFGQLVKYLHVLRMTFVSVLLYVIGKMMEQVIFCDILNLTFFDIFPFCVTFRHFFIFLHSDGTGDPYKKSLSDPYLILMLIHKVRRAVKWVVHSGWLQHNHSGPTSPDVRSSCVH